MLRNEVDRSRESIDIRIARLASLRHGVFSREEALRLGATRNVIQRRVANRRWEPVFPGVYRLFGAPPSWRQQLVASCLAAGSGAATSHLAAAGLGELAGFSDGALELSVERGRRVRLPGVVVHEVAELTAIDVTEVDAIPCTTPTRTLLDLAGVASENRLEEALDDALRRGLTSVRRLEWRAEQLGRRPGLPMIRRLLAVRKDAGAVPQSVLETRLLRLLGRARLPRPICQYQVKERGRLLAVVDAAYPDLKIAIEADGYRWHSSRARWEHDLNRSNELMRRGWRVIHVTANALRDSPEQVVRTITEALQVP